MKFLQIAGQGGGKSFVTELLRDGLEFPNAILQEGLRYIEDGLCRIFINVSALGTSL